MEAQAITCVLCSQFLELEEEKDEHINLLRRFFVSGATRAHIIRSADFFEVHGRRSAHHAMLSIMFW